MTNIATILVVIPAYNALPYLSGAIESVLQQSYPDFQCIVVNDGSTDGTTAFLNSIAALDPRLTIIHQKNMGKGATLNRSIQMCQSDYFAIMDADDLMFPDRLQRQLTFFNNHPDVVLLGGQYEFMTEKGTIPGNPVPLEHNEIVNRLKKAKPGICNPTVMFRTQVAQSIGGYRIQGVGEDYDFLLRMSEAGHIANIPELVLKYRVSEKSTSFSRRNEIRCGAAYAIYTYNLRLNGKREPQSADFEKNWNTSRNIFQKLADRFEDISFELFRRAVIQRCSGRRLFPLLYLSIAAFMRPCDLIWQLKARLWQRA